MKVAYITISFLIAVVASADMKSADYYSLSIISAFARYLGKGVGVNPNNYFGV